MLSGRRDLYRCELYLKEWKSADSHLNIAETGRPDPILALSPKRFPADLERLQDDVFFSDLIKPRYSRCFSSQLGVVDRDAKEAIGRRRG